MFPVILLNSISVFFAFLSKHSFRHGLKICFILIFLFLALRYDFGSDYQNYYIGFLNLNKYTYINYLDDSFHFEIGWLLLNRLFGNFGFFSMVIFLAAFNCIVYYHVIKKYVPVRYYWLAIFIYLFDPKFMLIHASAMRQSVAIAIFLLSIEYIYKRDLIRYLLCIGIAWLFHSSALILLPVYFIGYLNWKINNIWGNVIFLIFISLFIFGNIISPGLYFLIGNYFEGYEAYIGTVAEIGSGVGIIFMSMFFIFIIYFSRFQEKQKKIFFYIAIIGFMFIPLGLLVAMISRASMYFTPATIVVYPILMSNIKKPFQKFIFVFILMIFTLYTFFTFFNSEIFGKYYEVYRTIFSLPNL